MVKSFGGVENLEVEERPTPAPGAGEVLVRVTSIGMNHAELMGRRGEYRLSTGDPPFTPGLEAGGVIDAVGVGVSEDRVGERVVIGPGAPRIGDGGYGGTYRSHYVVDAAQALKAPDVLSDEQLGAVWLPYLTAWGCLIWKQGLQAGQVVGLPAASSSVALAAAQVVRQSGAVPIGFTRSEGKAEQVRSLETAVYEHVIVTNDEKGEMRPWHRDLKGLTNGRGVDVFFDPVASGDYLNTEIRSLANDGCIWVYGLLGTTGAVDVTPLIRKRAAIRGWGLTELVAAGESAWREGCEAVLSGFASGVYLQHIARVFGLSEVREAHTYMERGEHLGKLVLVPDGGE